MSDVTAGLVAAFNLAPAPSVTCVDQSTHVLCSGVFDTQTFRIDASVTYPTADTIAPLVTLVGSASETIPFGLGYADPGATWIDNRDGTGTLLATSGSVNTNVLGTYTLEYKIIDNAGNASTVTRTVTVADLMAPVITVLGLSSLTRELDEQYSDSGATWVDDIDGSGSLFASGESLMTAVGTYTLIYTKTDAAGNTGTGARSVTVVDTIAPLLTILTPFERVDASVYQISGNTLRSNLVEILSGSTVLASMAPV